ncbi:PREDICTED: signal recognition particle 14 kDa protein-like isoform X2 [Priapulus caudatus]|uniref:Signal recognition particle 14 kDa protein n=1 Tax=Priapulus caudatus TaxID=37621 RepID=A0ABM1F3Y0_PRICU|nr:PREDICTED: signal recognition particle 14 kDa protein-like isoform X2 [Priapulus caudatus]
MKKYDGRTKPKPTTSKQKHLQPPNEYKCLMRATLGNRKLSTIINAKDVNKFQLAYSNVLKANLEGLRKRDKKTKMAKAT